MPRPHNRVRYGATTYTHSYRAESAAFFDARFATLLRESYIRGRQEHRSARGRSSA